MNYDFYRTFVVLAEVKNFSKAAEKLNIVQSTVSNRIQELEKYLKTNLFTRTNKSVMLTQAGMNFLPYAKRIVEIEEEGLNTIDKLNYEDTIKIGTVHSFYSGYIKNSIKKFMKLNSKVAIEIVIDHTPNLLEALSDNLIDLGFVCALPKSDKFVCTDVLKDEFILVAKNSDEFKDVLSIEELINNTLLYADTGDSFIEYIECQTRCKLDFQFSINQVLEIVEYLREGFGYAFILKSLITEYIKTGELKEVKVRNTDIFTLEGYVVAGKSKMQKDALACFVKLLSEEINREKL